MFTVLPGTTSSETSRHRQSEFAMTVQTKQARVCGADPQLLSSLVGSDSEVMVTVPNEHLERIASFQEESDLWVIGHVARFLPTTRITHVLAGDDVVTSSPGSAYFLVPAMLNLRSSLAAAGLDDSVVVTSAVSADAVASPAWSDVAAHTLRFLRATGAPLFLKSEAGDANVDAAMLALGVSSGVAVVVGELGARRGEVATYHTYSCGSEGGVGKRRSLASGTFCVALQNADPTALQAGLSWACGSGHADCSAIQPGGPCYQDNNLPALASYAFNEYYQQQSSTGATCSFNGTATTTTSDPSKQSKSLPLLQIFFPTTVQGETCVVFMNAQLMLCSFAPGSGSCVFSGR
jgi:glucan endo-1,3-beta-glucosidase 4